MKKVLLASTALVAFAGAASAEIALSGSAEMGLFGLYSDTKFGDVGGFDADNDPLTPNVTSEDNTLPAQFIQDIDITFSMSGETDGGLAFGASVDLDEGGDGSAASDNDFDDGGATVFLSGDFGRITMGDTDGAVDFVITEAGNIGNPGSLTDNETSHVGYLGDYLDGSGDGQIVRYDYSLDAFTFAVSIEQDTTGAQTATSGLITEDADDLVWAVGFGYEFEFNGGSVDLGIGYQYADSASLTLAVGQEDQFGVDFNGDGDLNDGIGPNLTPGETAATAVGAVVNLDNGLSAGFEYTFFDLDDNAPEDEANHFGIGVGYAFDAFSVHFNYGMFESGDSLEATGWGIAAGYDLGGGASILFGYGSSETDSFDFTGDGTTDEVSVSSYSLGLSFSF